MKRLLLLGAAAILLIWTISSTLYTVSETEQ